MVAFGRVRLRNVATGVRVSSLAECTSARLAGVVIAAVGVCVCVSRFETGCFQGIRTVIMGRNSSVGIATRYGLDDLMIESRWGARFSAPFRTGPGAHPASYTMCTGSFPRVKRPGRGVDHPSHLAPRLKKD
jgi:hypothetical protein